MAAPKGNSFWKNVEHPGRPKTYTPDELWEKATDFFQDCDANPWLKNEVLKGGDFAGTIIQVPTSRPYTISGFSVFAGISTKTFENYHKDEDFLPITTRIREIMATQKFEGAAVGAFNANIIARDLGMVDKSENQVVANIQITGMEVK